MKASEYFFRLRHQNNFWWWQQSFWVVSVKHFWTSPSSVSIIYSYCIFVFFSQPCYLLEFQHRKREFVWLLWQFLTDKKMLLTAPQFFFDFSMEKEFFFDGHTTLIFGGGATIFLMFWWRHQISFWLRRQNTFFGSKHQNNFWRCHPSFWVVFIKCFWTSLLLNFHPFFCFHRLLFFCCNFVCLFLVMLLAKVLAFAETRASVAACLRELFSN